MVLALDQAAQEGSQRYCWSVRDPQQLRLAAGYLRLSSAVTGLREGVDALGAESCNIW